MSNDPEMTVEVTWQEAVARLARERTVTETCAALLKKHDDATVIAGGALAYGEAKAEYDGIIGGLIVALARKAEPTSLPDLEARLREARGVLPERGAIHDGAPRTGERVWFEEAVKGAVGGVTEPLLDAIKAIWLRCRDDDAPMRKTIETQLEAAALPDFAAVKGGP